MAIPIADRKKMGSLLLMSIGLATIKTQFVLDFCIWMILRVKSLAKARTLLFPSIVEVAALRILFMND